MLSPKNAGELAAAIWQGPRQAEMERLDRIDRALRTTTVAGFTPTVQIPEDSPAVMKELARKSETNYLQLLVRVFRQALRVDGYLTDVPEVESPWRWWQANRLDARQGGLHDSALKYGCGYARVLPGAVPGGGRAPAVKLFTPRYMTAVYADVESDEWPLATAHLDGEHVVLTDEVAEYRFGVEDRRGIADRLRLPSQTFFAGPSALTFIEHRVHDIGVTPVVRYRDMMLLDGEEQLGIVEPAIQIQERIDETGFQQMVAQYVAAFKQRYVLGWMPETDAEELKAAAARIWYIDRDPSEVRVDQLDETDLTRYIEAGNQARRDLAASGQIPVQTFGVDGISNISDATLAGLEADKNRRASEIATSLGESHEQALRLMAQVAGDEAAAADYSSEVRWAQREARSWAGTIDGLVKLVQAEILAKGSALEMVPGFTDQQIEKARAEARAEAGRGVLDALRAQASSAPLAAPNVVG